MQHMRIMSLIVVITPFFAKEFVEMLCKSFFIATWIRRPLDAEFIVASSLLCIHHAWSYRIFTDYSSKIFCSLTNGIVERLKRCTFAGNIEMILCPSDDLDRMRLKTGKFYDITEYVSSESCIVGDDDHIRCADRYFLQRQDGSIIVR